MLIYLKEKEEIFLTHRGEEVYRYANSMFSNGLRLVDKLSQQEVGGYDVSISVESAIESSLTMNLLTSYYSSYKIFGQTRSRKARNFSQTIHFVENDIVDIAITATEVVNDAYCCVPLRNISPTFVVSKLFSGMSFQDILNRVPLGFVTNETSLVSKISRSLADKGVYVKETLYSEHQAYLTNLCINGEIVLTRLLGLESSKEHLLAQGLIEHELLLDYSTKVYAIYKKSNENLLFIRKFNEIASL